MGHITIRRLKNGDWCIRQPNAWGVWCQPFSRALHEATHYAMEYDCQEVLDKALDRFMETMEKR